MAVTNITQTIKTAASGLPGAGLANFFALRGRKIYEACGVLWYSLPGRFLMALPYQRALDPLYEETHDLLRSSKASGVRFLSDRWSGLEGGIYVRRSGSYDLKTVHIKHRQRVRKGLPTLEVRHVEEAELLGQGLQLNRDTMARQGRYDPEFGEVPLWNRLVSAMRDCPEIDAQGAFDGKRLCAYMILCKEDRWLHILHQMSRLDSLELFPNHTLTYSVTKAASEDSSLEGVCYGLISLVAEAGLHEYKLRFGYEVIPRACAFVLNHRLEPLLNNSVARWSVRQVRRLCPKAQRLELIDTILCGASLTSCGTLPRNSQS